KSAGLSRRRHSCSRLFSLCVSTRSSHLSVATTASPLSYTRSLHDALPISRLPSHNRAQGCVRLQGRGIDAHRLPLQQALFRQERSEEHTSELQSRFDVVCRLLLEKKKASPCCWRSKQAVTRCSSPRSGSRY